MTESKLPTVEERVMKTLHSAVDNVDDAQWVLDQLEELKSLKILYEMATLALKSKQNPQIIIMQEKIIELEKTVYDIVRIGKISLQEK